MIYTFILISSLLHVNMLYCWGSSGSNVNGDIKQDVNFYGKLITQQGQEYTVNNISIQGKYKKITMYDKPKNHEKPVLNNETKQLEIKLDVNPFTDLSSAAIDLSEETEINVPSPNTIWIYQKKERQQKLEFIEINIVSKSSTKRSYLIERKTRINCNEIDTSGPREKNVPISALSSLIIEGYSTKISVAGSNQKCIQTTTCPSEKKISTEIPCQ